ncbi:hypothetical protein LIP_2854 [Limnochorda pilosa]|uniref:Uncharacterized protein n=1 Tax=Limnochorda pilosa TaxID=1555112 RepID=A0A0K2SNI1_LIMPI|nr:hypothetical protein LIP_2854 [Limnochorda pilosa]
MLLLTLAAAPATAQGYSFNVSPLLIELEGPPGSSLPFEISISNESADRTGEFTVLAVPLQQDRGGNYRVASEPGGHSADGWIQVSPEAFTLPPGGGQVIQGQLTFPRSFRGGAYAGVVLRLKPEEGPREGPQQVFRNELVVIVEAVAVTPGVRPDLYISKLAVLSAGQPGLEQVARQFGPEALLFSAELTNEGNVHGFARGQLSLWDASGRKIREIPLGAGRGAVLPGATVQLTSVLPTGLPPGEYTLQAVVYYGGPRPAITRQSFTVGEQLLQAAQGGRGARIAVEPETVSFELVPGAARFAALRIRNLDRVPVTVTGRVISLVYDAAGNPNVEDVPADGSAAGWTLLRPESVTLAPGQTRSLQVGVRTPRGAGLGARYAQVLLTATPEIGKEGFVETQVNVPIYALLGEELAPAGELSALAVEASEDGRFLVVSTEFSNHGTVHTTPSAQVLMELKTLPEPVEGAEYVGDPIWVETAKIEVPPAGTPVLPGGTRNLGALLSRPETPGEYRIRVTVRYPGGTPLVQERLVTLSNDGVDAAATPPASSPDSPGEAGQP